MPHQQIKNLRKNDRRVAQSCGSLYQSSDWNKALEEVDKALAIEPNNMYAMAYKDRINVSLTEEKKKLKPKK